MKQGKRRYYAVREGTEVGIFESWEEAKKRVEGYSHAEHKAFSSREEALIYLNGDTIPNVNCIPTLSEYQKGIKTGESSGALHMELAKLICTGLKKGKSCILLLADNNDNVDRYVARSIQILAKYGYTEKNFVVFQSLKKTYTKEAYLKFT